VNKKQVSTTFEGTRLSCRS